MTASVHDSHPYPIYNARFRLIAPLLDADGDLITGATAPDSEISQDCGTFADCTNEITEIATTSGMYFLDLISTELDCKSATIIIKTTSAGAKTTPIVLYPTRLPVIRTGTAQAGGVGTITLDTGAANDDNAYSGCIVNITNNSPANALGQARRIVSYVGSTRVATIEGLWGTNPSSASTFEILLTPEVARVAAWGGGAILTPSFPGTPEVDIFHYLGAPPPALVSSRFDASVGAIAANAITATSIATDAITAAKIANAAIDAATFAAGAIDATAIAADAITDAKVSTDMDAYHAKCWVIRESTTTDHYAVVYFKNGQPVTSGITTPLIQVIKASDGTDLIASTALTEVGSLGIYKKDESTNKMVAGAIYFAKITGTIDGTARVWLQQIGRDSA